MNRIAPKITGWAALIIGLVLSLQWALAGEPIKPERTFSFSYMVQLEEFPQTAKTVRLWLPVPQNSNRQEIRDLVISSPVPYRITTDPEFGNKMLFVEGAAGDLSGKRIEMNFVVHRLAVQSSADYERSLSASQKEELAKYLKPDSLVPTDGEVAAEAHRVAANQRDVVSRARALYNDLYSTMRYDKSGTGWGRGDALYACDARQGNCTDFHSLFIGMARSLDMPARFIIGFPLPENKAEGEVKGYHCWAEFYVPDKGWMPVDISEANKHPAKKELLFGGLDADRVQFTIGRDIQVQPPVSRHRLNYFIYPFMLLDGKISTNYQTKFTFKDLKKS